MKSKYYSVEKYGLWWNIVTPELVIEMQMVQHGGLWKRKDGTVKGRGLLFHFKRGLSLLWPDIDQHRWFNLFLENWLAYQYVGVLGPKNSGKTLGAAVFHLFDYYCWPTCTTVLFSSTTKEMLENRVWGEVKKRHKEAVRKFSFLPGHLIEGRMRIVTDDHDQRSEGRDFRNGLMGVPIKQGGALLSMSDIIGIKNKRKRLCGDELQALPKGFIDATANFMEPGADCRVTGMGNPNETTNSLGILCEPADSIGGWEGGIDQIPKTKTWKTRFENGICIHFPGGDSPNFDVKPDAPIPYPYLMTREQMDKDARTWGRDDWHYKMFNEGMMPKGQGSHRIITRQLCVRHGAMLEPVWANSERTKITFLDAAYRASGGDRCVFGQLEFGEELPPAIDAQGTLKASGLAAESKALGSEHQIIALVDMMIIPIKPSDFDSPEDQIVMFVKNQCALRHVPPENFFFDAGMRTSLVTAFSRLWSPAVNSIDFGGKPSERMVSGGIDVSCRDYYSKFVTELWYSVRLIIEAGQFRGMTEEVMLEGCAREWKHAGNNKIEVETKEEMKSKTGKSPDLFDALCAGIEGARQRGFMIKRLAAAEAHSKTDSGWKQALRLKASRFWESGQLRYL